MGGEGASIRDRTLISFSLVCLFVCFAAIIILS